MTVANKMRVYGEKMEDVKIIKKILRTLTEIFNYIVCCIEESKDIDNLSVDELQSSLIVHEQKFRKNHGEEQVLKVSLEEGKGRGRGRTAYKVEEGAVVAITSTKLQLNAIGVINWAISSLSALLGTKKLTMSRILTRKRRCC